MKNGVPFDVAMNMDEEERMAYGIVFAEFEGNEWDWDRRRWKERE